MSFFIVGILKELSMYIEAPVTEKEYLYYILIGIKEIDKEKNKLNIIIIKKIIDKI